MWENAKKLALSAWALAALSVCAPAAAQTVCAPGAPQVLIYHAGSLTAAFSQVEKRFTQQTGICVVDVAAGSLDAARRITAGQEPCDIYASVDYEDIELFLKPAGYADYTIRFAQGAMVLAYTTSSKGAASIAAGAFNPLTAVPEVASDWYLQLTQPGVLIGGSKARIPGTRVVWGLTVLKTAPNPANAVRFLQLLFSSQGVALQAATGPEPINPPTVYHHDYAQLPVALRPLVQRR